MNKLHTTTHTTTTKSRENLKLLNEALATELICVLRYYQNAVMCDGILGTVVAHEFKEHAGQELEHAQAISERIRQLGGTPHWNPADLPNQSHAEYRESASLAEMIKNNLEAELIAIQKYRELILHFGEADPTTRRLMESILEAEEEHLEDLENFRRGNEIQSSDRGSSNKQAA